MTGFVMIDIETLGTTPDAEVLEIGVVEWPDVTSGYHLASSRRLPPQPFRARDEGTIAWWSQQSQTVRDKVLHQRPPGSVLTVMDEYLPTLDFDIGTVWCYGASFDFPILASLLHDVGLDVPWTYRQQRDLRTVVNCSEGGLEAYHQFLRKHSGGLKHSAMEDAVTQARYLHKLVGQGLPIG